MKKLKSRNVSVFATLYVAGCLLFPVLGSAQQLARAAISSFPADTQQIAYTNLAELRSSSDYPRIQEKFLSRQLRYFQDFLRTMGVEPDRDIDEVILGWRTEVASATNYFGMAQGRFQPDRVRKYFSLAQLPVRQYDGAEIYAYGSGSDPGDVYFTFLDASSAAFGKLADLKAILDVRTGAANALDTNTTFSSWEGELESTAPQWGILNGKAAANLVAPWMTGGKKTKTDFSTVFSPVQAVLYRVEWDGGFDAHIALVCRDAQSAAGLATLAGLLQNAQQHQPVADATSGLAPVFQNLEIHQNAARVELSASGPPEALEQLLRGTM